MSWEQNIIIKSSAELALMREAGRVNALALAAVKDAQVITMDGCKLACATLNVRQAGGAVARDFTVLDVYRRNKALKPQGISELTDGGLALARALADEVVQKADELIAGGADHPQNNGGCYA